MLLPAMCERKYLSEVVSARLGKEKGGFKSQPDLPRFISCSAESSPLPGFTASGYI